jgi:nucleotide-binding universal stress UspA family protein
MVIPDVAAAGAASSLIFLISFAIVHWAAILAARRSGDRGLHLLPWAGAVACLALAVFQGFAVRAAGSLATVWLGFGSALYFTLFAPGARAADASAEGRDPDLVRLRGRSPLVLVPIANPASAASLVSVAGALATPQVGRILLLSVVRPPERWDPDALDGPLQDAKEVLGESLYASFGGALAPETLVTVAPDPWPEIVRVARGHHCESMLLGLSRIEDATLESHLEWLVSTVASDVVVLRAPTRFELARARRVLVPIGGRRDHSYLRARLLGSLSRSGERTVTFLRVLPAGTPRPRLLRTQREMESLARDEVPGAHDVLVVEAEDTAAELVRRAGEHDLVVLGIQRQSRSRKVLGSMAVRLARESSCPLLLISRGG